MTLRRSARLALLALLVAVAAPGTALAQGGDAPTQLWDEFPLDETAPATPPDADEGAADVPRALPVGGDGGGLTAMAVVAPALLGLAAAAAALSALRHVRRRGSTPHWGEQTGAPALGYTTVAVAGEEQSERLNEEARLIESACQDKGLVLDQLVRDADSPLGSALRRPGLAHALERLGAGAYAALVVSRLDRLTHDAGELAEVLTVLGERSVRLIAIDVGLDTATPDGRLTAEALVAVGRLDEQREDKAPAEEQSGKRPAPSPRGQRSSGRPSVADRPQLKRRIVEMRAGGMTLQAIADTLNAEGVPTVRGGAKWRPSSVQAAAGYKRPNRNRDRKLNA